jgi:hypothetical protein
VAEKKRLSNKRKVHQQRSLHARNNLRNRRSPNHKREGCPVTNAPRVKLKTWPKFKVKRANASVSAGSARPKQRFQLDKCVARPESESVSDIYAEQPAFNRELEPSW